MFQVTNKNGLVYYDKVRRALEPKIGVKINYFKSDLETEIGHWNKEQGTTWTGVVQPGKRFFRIGTGYVRKISFVIISALNTY